MTLNGLEFMTIEKQIQDLTNLAISILVIFVFNFVYVDTLY